MTTTTTTTTTRFSVFRSSVRSHATHAIGELKNSHYIIPKKIILCFVKIQNKQFLQIFRMEKFKSSSIVGKNSGIATRTHGRVDIPGKRTHSPCPSLTVCMFTSARHLGSVLEFQVIKVSSQISTKNIFKLKYIYKT